jgi:hypothetical protein
VSHVGVLIHTGIKSLRRQLAATPAARSMEGGPSHA